MDRRIVVRPFLATIAATIVVAGSVVAAANPIATANSAATAGPVATAAATTSAVRVPEGVRISAALARPLSTLATSVGDTFAFTTTKDATLGGVSVPAGTPGHGRVAVATRARDRVPAAMALQADSIDLPDGRVVSVNIDTARPIRGHLATTSTRVRIIPIIIGVVPVLRTSRSGDLVIDAGTRFDVVTVAPRTVPAALATSPATAAPAATPMAASTAPRATATP
ncbi:MAG: hypothetical protein NVS3B17_14190 [Vulcanimicrobiaceae bacterium]